MRYTLFIDFDEASEGANDAWAWEWTQADRVKDETGTHDVVGVVEFLNGRRAVGIAPSLEEAYRTARNAFNAVRRQRAS